jgi:hypothetical protein
VLYVLYTDDSILAGKDLGETDESTTKYWNTEMGLWRGFYDVSHLVLPREGHYKIKTIGFLVNGACYISGGSNGTHNRARFHHEEEAQSLAYHCAREGVARDEIDD